MEKHLTGKNHGQGKGKRGEKKLSAAAKADESSAHAAGEDQVVKSLGAIPKVKSAPQAGNQEHGGTKHKKDTQPKGNPPNEESEEDETKCTLTDAGGKKFSIWSPYQSKLAAILLKGAQNIHLVEGSKVIQLGVTSSCHIAQLANIVGKTGLVYVLLATEAPKKLVSLANRVGNIIFVIDNPLLPYKYRQLISGSVDYIFCDVQHEEKLRILILHARHFLKPGGYFATTVPQKVAWLNAVKLLQTEQLQSLEKIRLEPYMPEEVIMLGIYNRTTS